MVELSQEMNAHVFRNPDFLKIYIFHEVKKAVIWQKSSEKNIKTKYRGRMFIQQIEKNKKKTLLETFNEMCEVYGNNAMEYAEFEYWYIKFYSGNFDMDHGWRSTVDCRPSALQRFIFTDVVMDVPIWKSFKKYCEIEENETTDYKEFEFWYMRFYSKNFEMDYDRSADPKHRSFTDLPIHIFEKITKKFDFSEKLIIRQVSKPIQSLVDSWKPNIEKIKIFHDSMGVCWNFDDMAPRIVYYGSNDEDTSDEEGSMRRSICNKPDRYRFLDLKAVLGNSKLVLNSLEIAQFDKKHTEQFQEILNSMKKNTKIHVENFKLRYPSDSYDLLPIIEQFNPDVLKEVYLEIKFDRQELENSKELMTKLAMSEHLKNVKMLKIEGNIGQNTQPFDCFLGCPRVTIENYAHMTTAKQAELAIRITF